MIIRLAALASVLVAPTAQCSRRTLVGEVTYVRDGDTIELGEMAIRLQGLAAPEWNEPGGTEAREAMIALVHGRMVRCERLMAAKPMIDARAFPTPGTPVFQCGPFLRVAMEPRLTRLVL